MNLTQNTNKDIISGEQMILEKWPYLVAIKYLFDKVGFPTALVLFGLGVWTGHVPSPYLDIAQSLEKHVIQTDKMMLLLEEKLSDNQCVSTQSPARPPLTYQAQSDQEG